ncbi:MurR/RpiR family transcriptional regulator [Streptacidiphilus sp. ASG 303]|uniref:MurR/RpiR family transcriptional regulator n=1 Tax=Streptomycetaceae TaxID=2062 RepID=UPI001E44814E|nr:MurR/RpiR family transcriptional regulator [Streptacidiphilus sp. ASG 303]MCD0480855.1 MurR/RpiR family transcriptional regulator [Streptacidiphilus sp. ASG 303]
MASASVAETIRQRLGECSPAERKVGRVLLAGYPSAGFETVARLAERAGVSAPTVIRFVNRLGFRGFPDFQAVLRAELDERNASPLSLYAADGRSAGGEEGEAPGEALLRRGSGMFSAEVERTLGELPPHDLKRAVDLLADRKRRVTLAGGRFTHLLARYLGLHLMQMRDEVHFLPDRDVERTAVLAALGRRDVLVVFDYRRYEAASLEWAGLCEEQGGRVVLFTDTWLSPVTAHAEVVLPSRVGAPSPYDSLVPTLAVVETVVAGVLAELGDDAHRHMQRGEQTARRAGLH